MNKKTLSLKIAIVVAASIFGAYMYPSLPGTIPTHWNINGAADSFAPKEKAIFMVPVFMIVMLAMFQFLPKLDPRKENYPKFEKAWEAFQFAILGFFAYAYALSLLAANSNLDVSKYMMAGIGVLFIILGNYMGKIRRNYFIGIKLPWTIDNEEVWNKTHRLGGKMFMIAGLLFFINAFLKFSPGISLAVLLILILLVPVVYSYLIFKKINDSK